MTKLVDGCALIDPETMRREQLIQLVYTMVKMVNETATARDRHHNHCVMLTKQRESVMELLYELRDAMVEWHQDEISDKKMIVRIRTILFGH